MEKLVLDSELRARLKDLSCHIELCDESGKVLGHFLPAEEYETLFYAALSRDSPHSPEELRRRHRETGGRSLKDIWRDLGRSE